MQGALASGHKEHSVPLCKNGQKITLTFIEPGTLIHSLHRLFYLILITFCTVGIIHSIYQLRKQVLKSEVTYLKLHNYYVTKLEFTPRSSTSRA